MKTTDYQQRSDAVGTFRLQEEAAHTAVWRLHWRLPPKRMVYGCMRRFLMEPSSGSTCTTVVSFNW